MTLAKTAFDTLLYSPLFKVGMRLGAIPARLGLVSLSRPLMRANAEAVKAVRRAREQRTVADVGAEWVRMFPPTVGQDLVSADDETVIYETRVHCPLRGTGDVHACYRMMEFDRWLLETIGGQLVVLHSQAEEGRTTCQVAIRRWGASTEDLVPAHKR